MVAQPVGSITERKVAGEMNEKSIYEAFRISVLLKGVHALIEILSGVLLALVGAHAITRTVGSLARWQLGEHPHDPIATALLNAADGFTVQTEHFYAFYLVSHGVVNLALVIGLLRNKLWAYPASLVVLTLFVAYQVYRYSYTHGFGLILLTVFDLIVMALIWHEYRIVRRHLAQT
jgi:uncharacterized membrane protein